MSADVISITGTSGEFITDVKQFAFPLIRQVFPTLVAKDLVSVQPMTAIPEEIIEKPIWNDPVDNLMHKIGYDVKPDKVVKKKVPKNIFYLKHVYHKRKRKRI